MYAGRCLQMRFPEKISKLIRGSLSANTSFLSEDSKYRTQNKDWSRVNFNQPNLVLCQSNTGLNGHVDQTHVC